MSISKKDGVNKEIIDREALVAQLKQDQDRRAKECLNVLNQMLNKIAQQYGCTISAEPYIDAEGRIRARVAVRPN